MFLYVPNPSKPTLKLNVWNQEKFDDAMVPLRIVKHKRMQSANEFCNKCVLQVSRRRSLCGVFFRGRAFKGKGKGKARPKSKADRARDTIRPTNLVIESSGFGDPDDPFDGLVDQHTKRF